MIDLWNTSIVLHFPKHNPVQSSLFDYYRLPYKHFLLPTYEKGFRETRQNRTNSEDEFLSSKSQCTLAFLTFFWAVPLLASGRRFLEPIDLFLYDPSGLEMARWTARNAVSGPIHINYHLASETPVGKWKLSAKMRSFKLGKPSQLNIKVNMSKVAEFHGIFSKTKTMIP